MRFPPYDTTILPGDTVRPRNGGTFARAGGVATAIVTAIRVYNCPMEGPEWMAETTAGDYLTPVLEVIT